MDSTRCEYRMDSRHGIQPAPPPFGPCLLRLRSPLLSLSSLAFHGREEGAAEVQRESFRCRWEPGVGRGAPALASPRPCPSRRRARTTAERVPRVLGAGCGGPARAAADPAGASGDSHITKWSHWGRTRALDARRRWLGLDCCTFFFVRCIFRNKKKSPTLHTTSSASQDRKPCPSSLGNRQ